MKLLKIGPEIHRFTTFAEFAKEFELGEGDVLITNEFIYKPYMEKCALKCHVIFQEKFGNGEPSDKMMNAILEEAKKVNFKRVIAVGGGTVIDSSKLIALQGVNDVVDAFERKIPIHRDKELIILPTTCGTGSEITNISIAEIICRGTKMGLADDQLLADAAVLVPELLTGLPFKFYLYSSIDALIHATESLVSPKSNPYTEIFCTAAVNRIMDVFKNIVDKGEEYRKERFEDMLMASNFAGIAFGNTGVGAVHALSYPLGGNYHVPHGQSNYEFYTTVFKKYREKKPKGSIETVTNLLAEQLGCSGEKAYDELDNLLGKMLKKEPLSSFGMKKEEVEGFADLVIKTQQRLLANNYVELSRNEIRDMYAELY